MNGKDKCTLLKSIRVKLAELNNISYTPHPCNNIDDCIGTCEVCDAESLWLLQTLKRMENKGFPIIYNLSETEGFFKKVKIERKRINRNKE